MNKYTFEERIYTYHIDFVGHVNNINYIKWMENARVRLLEEIGMPVTKMTVSEGIAPVLVDTYIRYKKSLYLHNMVTIETWFSKLENASLVIDFSFYNEKRELCATGKQKCTFIDRKTSRPLRMTDEHRLMMKKFYIPEHD
jgi:acyl-CoA thioester hydrolase